MRGDFLRSNFWQPGMYLKKCISPHGSTVRSNSSANRYSANPFLRSMPRICALILISFLGLASISCGDAGDFIPGSGDSKEDLSTYEKKLKEMSWYDFENRDYRTYTEEDLEPYTRKRPERERSSGGLPVFNPIIILWVALGAVVVLLLFYLFRNGVSFQRRARSTETDLPDLAHSTEQVRKRDPLFDDAIRALEEGRFSDVMETLLEILVRFSHSEKYLARRTGFTPREFQRLVRNVAPTSFVELADDLSPAFEETVYALRPRSPDFYRQLIHRMEKQLQGVGR